MATPTKFRPMRDPTSDGTYLHFHRAIIKEFNKPNRKRVISWFVINYVGDLTYHFSGRRVVAVNKNYGTPYFENQKFFSGAR